MEYLYLLICLAIIVFSADALVAGAVTIAKRFKISDFVIGAVIVGVGTSFPELVVSSIGAIEGNSDIAIGNVIGSNIFNLLLILGVGAQITPLTTSGITIVDYGMVVLAALLPWVLGLDGRLSRKEGAAMFTCFVLYNIYLLNSQMHFLF
jgi:cation:H+ antiporter